MWEIAFCLGLRLSVGNSVENVVIIDSIVSDIGYSQVDIIMPHILYTYFNGLNTYSSGLNFATEILP